jgi:hypothetical protein
MGRRFPSWFGDGLRGRCLLFILGAVVALS